MGVVGAGPEKPCCGGTVPQDVVLRELDSLVFNSRGGSLPETFWLPSLGVSAQLHLEGGRGPLVV